MLAGLRACNRVVQNLASCRFAHSDTKYVCIVGSGPAGFYTAQHLLKMTTNVCVDIVDKLPVPFGLVRYGVAPDHPEVKNVINSFTSVANDARCRFFGNLTIGTDVTVFELMQHYHAVVLAYGSRTSKELNIPGEKSNGVVSASQFVGWYNGLPENSSLRPNLTCQTAVILGHGNVALDVARMLLTPVQFLEKTDVTAYALDALKKSKIEKVIVAGRRGPLQVAFTIKELREMIRLPDCRPVLEPRDFEGIPDVIGQLPRQRKRLIELLCKTALENPGEKETARRQAAQREWTLKFLHSPIEFETKSIEGREYLSAVQFELNKLEEERAVGTGLKISIPCGLAITSVGYWSVSIDPDIPFDSRKGIIPNSHGRVIIPQSSETSLASFIENQKQTIDGSNRVIPGLYCSGWIKTGPIGVILTTVNDALETAQSITDDIKKGVLEQNVCESRNDLVKGIQKRLVTFSDWMKINEHEVATGKDAGKAREKIVSTDKMLNVVLERNDQ
jgi:adrenodoxin-NADP+ reductase